MKKNFIRCLTAAALLAAVLSLSAGCGSEASDANDKIITAAASDVVAGIVSAAGDSCTDSSVAMGDADFDDNFSDLYGIDEDLLTDGAFAYDSTGATADEITVLRVKDEDDTGKVEQALKRRMQKRQQDFNGYKPEESAKASEGKIFTCDHYVFMGICSDSSAAQSAFMKYMQSEAGTAE